VKAKEIAITKLVIQMGEREVPLTVEESRKLYAVLKEIFEEKEVVKEVHHHDRWHWYWGPSYCPTGTITTTGSPMPKPPTIWCNSSGDSLQMLSNTTAQLTIGGTQ